MAKLVYSMIASLDGYVADENDTFAWAAPDEELHAFINDMERSIGTYLYGRRMYETMVYWETAPDDPDESPISRDYAEVWQAADKIVYSATLSKVTSGRTRIERQFSPADVLRLKAESSKDLSIGGPHLAAQALAAGLVDECHLYVVPVIVGGGNRALPDRVRLSLELRDLRRFGNGAVHLHYAVNC